MQIEAYGPLWQTTQPAYKYHTFTLIFMYSPADHDIWEDPYLLGSELNLIDVPPHPKEWNDADIWQRFLWFLHHQYSTQKYPMQQRYNFTLSPLIPKHYFGMSRDIVKLYLRSKWYFCAEYWWCILYDENVKQEFWFRRNQSKITTLSYFF